MGADKANINDTVGEMNPSHEPVFISCDIKNNLPILEDAGIPEVLLDIGG